MLFAALSARTALPAGDEIAEARLEGRISEGDIPVLGFLRFLSDCTRLPVLVDSTERQILETTLTVTAPIDVTDPEVVIEILKTNHFHVERQRLPSGSEVFRVESIRGPKAEGRLPDDDRVIKLTPGGSPLDVGADGKERGTPDFEADEVASMVFTLKHVAPQAAITALKDLIAGSKTGASSPAFSIVEVQGSMTVIVKAKLGMLQYLKKLLHVIDVPSEKPDRIVEIIDLEHADAQKLAQFIEDFVGKKAQGRQPRAPRGGTPRIPAAPAGTPVPGATREPDPTFATRLFADSRTQKVVVETYSESDLKDVRMLVREMDVRPTRKREKIHVYQVRFLKAEEVALDLQDLLGAGGTTRVGPSGRPGLGTRDGLDRRGGERGAGRRTPQPGVASPPSRNAGPGDEPPEIFIVPHVETNSLLIQADPEDYAEVVEILAEIDVKRRQVILEAALVEVRASSALDQTIELLAGEPGNRGTRPLAASSFGTPLDPGRFDRVLPEAIGGHGALLAIMKDGKFPALVHFLERQSEAKVVATPFVVADDNRLNSIKIARQVFVTTPEIVGVGGGAGSPLTRDVQTSADAGIFLDVYPTINPGGAVFLDLSLTASEFEEEETPDRTRLPPILDKEITSQVTVPDGDIFVVGGLTRESRAKSVAKVPLLGDIPLLGRLFRSETTEKSTKNLYLFLRAHVLTDPQFEDGKDITRQALDRVHGFAPEMRPSHFDRPTRPPPEGEGTDATRPEANGRAPHASTSRHPRALEESGFEIDPTRGSWLVPLRRKAPASGDLTLGP
ncbi:MAG: hypothetical protein HY721_17350 [Planctomycetes bacterium]|nr:hypothetical protein [Planctomycetota bacterium]